MLDRLIGHKNAIGVVSLLFVIINAIGIAFEFYWLNLLPFALMVVYLTFFKLNILFYLLVFLVPLSVNVEDIGGVGIILPTEPILFGLLIITVMKLLRHGVDRSLIREPLTWVIILQVLWMFITSLTSELPIVSFKFLLARLWFLASFYYLAYQFLDTPKRIVRFFWVFISALGIVVTYTIIHHSMYGFGEKEGHWVMSPFFKDHTSYGAILAMIYPFLIWQSFRKGIHGGKRVILISILTFFTVAIILSYTRAAWVSLVGALGIYLVFKLKVKAWIINAIAIAGVVTVIVFWVPISQKLAKNKQDSSSNLTEHVKSISNVSSDASNLERLNRWNAAYKMFLDHPIVGTGPGTYAFVYAPYQDPEDKTIISTNAGDMGTAHSEYLGPLSESGLMGLILMLVLVGVIVYLGFTLNRDLSDPILRGIFMSVYLGIMTYVAHGLLNNYLDTDKASSLFWGFLAVMLVLRRRVGLVD